MSCLYKHQLFQPLTNIQGSVFTEFVDYKSVEVFLSAEPKPSWDGKELLIMSKEAYVEMKIKEKGLKGKAAVVKRDHITRKGFDAFREMRLAAEGKKDKKEAEKGKPEIFVELFGAKMRVLEVDGGSVAPEEVPHLRGSALRFSGCGGEVSFEEIKRPLKERFSRAPFVKYTKGDDAGLVGFDKALDEEDIAFVEEKIPTLNGKPVTWELPGGSSMPPSFRACGMNLIVLHLPFRSTQKRKSMRLELSGPTRRRSAHWACRRVVLEEGVVAELLAVGGAGVVDEQTGTLGVAEVVVVATAQRMAGTSRQARSVRERWSRMEGTMLGCGGKQCLLSRLHPHRKSPSWTVESLREYHSWQYTLLRLLL
jgi:hypothetical protein